MWKMWYYGCPSADSNESLSCPGGIPYGSVGMATSGDGLHWQPFGRVFTASSVVGTFDESRVAVGAVVRLPDELAQRPGELAMYYFGSGSGPHAMPTIGLARSEDGGESWARVSGEAASNAVLWPEAAVEGALAVTQPHVLVLNGSRLRMYYVALHMASDHSFHFALWQAESSDALHWGSKQQLRVAHSLGLGIGSLGLLPRPDGELVVMAGWELPEERDSIGVLLGDLNDTFFEPPRGEEHHLALMPSGAANSWDTFAVGCPFPLVYRGSLYVYFNGFERPNAKGQARSSIGLAVATNTSAYFDLKRVVLTGLIAV